MISVVMSAYKGEYYIEEAIRSVLCQLPGDGELIISDEKPGDATGRIIKRLADEDSRILYVEGRCGNATESIVTALRHCKGNRIFICSQNDVWLPDKIKRVCEALDEGADFVLHNAYITDEALNITGHSMFESDKIKKNVISNIINNTWQGSCMAFERRMLKFIMPIPKHIPDCYQWIGVICHIFGTVKLTDIPLSYCRRSEKKDKKKSSDEALRRRYFINKLYKRIFIRK